ncbi:hypothetical protein R6242_19355 [Iodobacter sp. CM08]|nr:hypothetical protein [Iodobacter sp. CM08]
MEGPAKGQDFIVKIEHGIASVKVDQDKSTIDMFGFKPKGRPATGRALTNKERSRRFRKSNFFIKIDRKSFQSGYDHAQKGLLETGEPPGVDGFSWQMGWFVGMGKVAPVGKIAEVLESMK